MVKDVSEERIKKNTQLWLETKMKDKPYQEVYNFVKRNMYVGAMYDKTIQTHSMTEDFAYCYCEDIYDNLPPELLQNVKEWLEDKPITDIQYYNHSIYGFMYMYRNKTINFIRAAKMMVNYIQQHDEVYGSE